MSELFKNLPDPTVTPAPVVAPVVKTEAEKLAEAVKPVVAAPVTQTVATPPVTAPNTPEAQDEDEIEDVEEEDIPTPMDELSMLKARAQMMGITHSNNIGIESLRAKINAKLNNEADTTDADGNTINQGNDTQTNQTTQQPPAPQEPEVEPERQISLREHMLKTQMKLIRLRITNLDPKKKDLPGEIITVANEYLGTVKKFVPFGEVTDGGYHVPECIYNVLKERTFVSIKTRKGPRGQTIVENQDAREFSLEILPPLTMTELAALATAQQAKGGLATD